MKQLQSTLADCGHACIAALLSTDSEPLLVSTVRNKIGYTERGLDLRQMRNGLQLFGCDAQIIAFDPSRQEAIPCPGIILLPEGHYVAILERKGSECIVFDPAVGEKCIHYSRLQLPTPSLGIELKSKGVASVVNAPVAWKLSKLALRHVRTRLGRQVLVLAAAAQLLALSVPLITKESVDKVSGAAVEPFSIAGIAIAFTLVSLVGNACTLVAQVGQREVTKRVSSSAFGELFDRLATKSLDWFQSRTSGYAFNQYQALQGIQGFYVELGSGIVTTLLMGVAGLIAIFFLSPWLVVPGFVSVALGSGIDLAYRRRLQNNASDGLSANQRLREAFYDLVTQLPALCRAGVAHRAKAKIRRLVRAASDVQIADARIQATRSALNSFVKVIENVAFVCLAAYFVKEYNYSLGVFVAAGLYKDLLSNAIRSTFGLWQKHALLAAHRLQLEELLREPSVPVEVTSGKVSAGQIDIRNCDYRYGPLDPLVLQNVNLQIRSGECAVIKGPSGAGKSTLLKLICGHCKPSRGEVLVDGYATTSRIDGIGVVLQTDRLITGSIRENILFLRDTATSRVSDADLFQALDCVGLSSFVSSLPMGLNTQIGESTAGLSGGQRQRILIARALFGRPRLLVFDEATSNLDVEGEREILKRLRDQGQTLVLCSHRPEVWQHADRLLTVNNGHISSRVDISDDLLCDA